MAAWLHQNSTSQHRYKFGACTEPPNDGELVQNNPARQRFGPERLGSSADLGQSSRLSDALHGSDGWDSVRLEWPLWPHALSSRPVFLCFGRVKARWVDKNLFVHGQIICLICSARQHLDGSLCNNQGFRTPSLIVDGLRFPVCLRLTGLITMIISLRGKAVVENLMRVGALFDPWTQSEPRLRQDHPLPGNNTPWWSRSHQQDRTATLLLTSCTL